MNYSIRWVVPIPKYFLFFRFSEWIFSKRLLLSLIAYSIDWCLYPKRGCASGCACLCMGTSGSLGCFQRLVAQVCEGLQRVQLYIDDIVVHSSHHVEDLEGVLARLTEYNLKLSPKKESTHRGHTKFNPLDISLYTVWVVSRSQPNRHDAENTHARRRKESYVLFLGGSVSYLRKNKMPGLSTKY